MIFNDPKHCSLKLLSNFALDEYFRGQAEKEFRVEVGSNWPCPTQKSSQTSGILHRRNAQVKAL